jgi:hypothetical protein
MTSTRRKIVMEDQRFDALVRAVAAGASRRRVLGALVGSLVALGGRQRTQAQGNSECADFCKEVFPPGRERGQCVSAAARGDAGNLCAACEADPTNVCLNADGLPTCDCGRCITEPGPNFDFCDCRRGFGEPPCAFTDACEFNHQFGFCTAEGAPCACEF